MLHYNMKAKLFVEEPTAETAQAASSSSVQAASAGGSNETSASAPAAPSAATTTAAAATLTIPKGASVQGNPAYEPDPLTVKVGDTIAVNNKDTAPHTVTNGKDATDPNMGKLFDTSIINAGDSAEIATTSMKPGEYPYHCSVHPYMTGTLTVQ
jgi:plastocyanin